LGFDTTICLFSNFMKFLNNIQWIVRFGISLAEKHLINYASLFGTGTSTVSALKTTYEPLLMNLY
jgi:hypothetical protein